MPAAQAETYLEKIRRPGRRVEKHLVAGAEHTYNPSAWESEVIQRSLRWFRETL
ncbi:MAG: hypothetical protein M1379_12620 [Firmicutes bacterium]|nr:hypothetical protein [Bacillota bacterium]